ncbi:MAG: hypothetical protein KDC38_14450 [Planctomycetes bacterium]|nr:hypothetical protein [Planctomycetota bacterium]
MRLRAAARLGALIFLTAFPTMALSQTCVGVSNVTCNSDPTAPWNAWVNWTPQDSYTEIRVLRNGLLEATLSGSSTIFFVPTTTPGGPQTYEIVGVCASGPASGASCTLTYTPLPCVPVFAFNCFSFDDSIVAIWDYGVGGLDMTSVSVARDGVPIATIGGSVESFQDFGLPSGTYQYTFTFTCPTSQDIESCTVVHVAPQFRRGDCNLDVGFDVSDPVALLGVLFISGTPAPACADACDANNDGVIDIADAVTMLQTLFTGGNPLPDPFPGCGSDTEQDALTCFGITGC